MVLFERYDTNYDGMIDLDEAAAMVRDMLPATRQRVSDEWVRVSMAFPVVRCECAVMIGSSSADDGSDGSRS